MEMSSQLTRPWSKNVAFRSFSTGNCVDGSVRHRGYLLTRCQHFDKRKELLPYLIKTAFEGPNSRREAEKCEK